MKRLVFVLAFIMMSLLSAVVESSELEECPVAEQSSIAKFSHSEHHKTDCHKNTCHDSNCFGSAHFGHGFYYLSNPYTVALPPSATFVLVFRYLNHQSFVLLDEIFRPPLAS